MGRFGGFLVQRGILSAAQLAEADQAQVVFGGRLGTNLVELGYLSIDEVERHLSDHLGIATAPAEWIEKPSDEACGAIPPGLIAKHKILPLHLEKRTLHVAMLDPCDPVQIDDIGFATGLRIVPYAIPEVQLLALLEHRFGLQREIRYINLGHEAARGRRAGPKKPDTDGSQPEVTDRAGAAAMEPIAESGDLIDEEMFTSLHERWESNTAAEDDAGGAESAAAETPIELGDLEQPAAVAGAESPDADVALLEVALARAGDRDQVSELGLRIARRYAAAAALFVVRGGVVSGFRGDGQSVSEQLSGILLPVESDCAMTRPATSRAAFRGPLPESGLDARLLASLGRGDAREVAVFPILIRDQVVNLLYADGGANWLGDTRFAALSALAALVSRAYERLILERKATGE